MVFLRLFLTHLRQNPRHTKITPLQNNFGKNTSTSVDDDLRVLVRKLRVGQDDLRNRQEELMVVRADTRSSFKTSFKKVEITKRD